MSDSPRISKAIGNRKHYTVKSIVIVLKLNNWQTPLLCKFVVPLLEENSQYFASLLQALPVQRTAKTRRLMHGIFTISMQWT